VYGLELILYAGHAVHCWSCGEALHALYGVVLLHLVIASCTVLCDTMCSGGGVEQQVDTASEQQAIGEQRIEA
jgi:hypothetical protein